MRRIILFIFVLTSFIRNTTHAQYWESLGSGINSSSNYGFGWVSSIAFYNGAIYAAGIFDSVGGISVNSIAKKMKAHNTIK